MPNLRKGSVAVILAVIVIVVMVLGIGGFMAYRKMQTEIGKQYGQVPGNFQFPGFGGGTGSGGDSSKPACVDANDYHAELIYARPKDAPSGLQEMAPKLKGYFKSADGIVNEEAKRFSVTAHLKVLCEKEEIAVFEANLPNTGGYYFSASGGTRDVLVRDLKSLGFNKPNAKYIAFYDGKAAGCGGGNQPCSAQQSLKGPDDRLSEDNVYNLGPDFALLYKIDEDQVKQITGGGFNTTYDMLAPVMMLHEYAHTLGAVQPSAPHSTKKEITDGQKHCADSPFIGRGGTDIMCKSDSEGEVFGNECSGFYPFRFDCNNDDYFNPKPEPGSYLATHWNLGSVLNRFIQFGQ